jgi:outer membrane lipoprotein-sorting protein
MKYKRKESEKMRIKCFMFCFFLLFTSAFYHVLPSYSQGPEKNARKIMEKTLNSYYYARNDGKADIYMRLVNKQGKERIREFIMLRLDKEEGGEQYYYAYFNKPPDVRRTVFMVWKHIDRDDDRWLYLPAIDLLKRISANDKRSSFVGSDFTYEDVSGRHLDDDEHTLLREEAIEGRNAYVIKSTPKDKGEVEFSYRLIWSDKETFLSLRVEHYNRRGELYKTLETKKIENIEGTPTVTEAVMKDLTTGHFTELKVSKIDYDVGLSTDVFQERFLRRPPRRWIKGE